MWLCMLRIQESTGDSDLPREHASLADLRLPIRTAVPGTSSGYGLAAPHQSAAHGIRCQLNTQTVGSLLTRFSQSALPCTSPRRRPPRPRQASCLGDGAAVSGPPSAHAPEEVLGHEICFACQLRVPPETASVTPQARP